MKKSAYFSDLAFAFTATFLPALCFLRFQRVPIGWATLVAIAFGMGTTLTARTLLRKKYQKECSNASERKEAEMLAIDLALLSQQEACEWAQARWHILLGNEQASSALTSHRGECFLEDEAHLATCRFSGEPLGADGLLALLSYPTEKEYVLFCNELTNGARELAERFSLRIIGKNELYQALKKAGSLPKSYQCAHAFDKKKKRRGKLWFQKRNAKPFLTGGTLTLLSSLFSPFPYYYLVMGIALVSLSAVLRFWGT